MGCLKALQQQPTAVAPQPSTPQLAYTPELRPRTRAGFLHIYGWLGVPIIGAFLLSAVWTMALAVIQLTPTTVANALMMTEQFDYGEFWLLSKPDDRIAIPSAAALAVFSVGYVALAVLTLFPDKLLSRATRQAARGPATAAGKPSALKSSLQAVAVTAWPGAREPTLLVPRRVSTRLLSLRARLTALAYDPDTPVLALPKLIIQTMTLVTYLDEGFPIPLVTTYTLLLLVNWVLTSFRALRTRPDPTYILSRFCYSFDLFFAVFAPLHVLTFAYNRFEFDRDVFATRVAALSESSFDRTARLFADPTEISLVRIAFQYLQLTTATRLLLKCLLNAFTIAKWRHVIVHLVQLAVVCPADLHVLNNYHPRASRWERCRRVLLAATFCCAGLGMVTYAIVAVTTTSRVCRSHPQCKVPSYQWNVGTSQCSCIVFVDRETRVTTMAEWLDPPDTTQNLAALAYTGHLKIVQIINRQLPTLPDELRRCRHLEQLILIYTKTLVVPDWAKEFENLEYLHLEGDLTDKKLMSMPRDLFAATDKLLFLHLGCLTALPFVPELRHLVRLEYLVLAMLHSVTEIPALDALVNLKRLNIIDNIALVSLPRVASLRQLSSFALSNRVPVCCNGFLPGGCNLTAFSCLDRSSEGETRVQCTAERYPPEDYKALVEIQGLVCPPIAVDLKTTTPTVESVDQLCGGVFYKQCTQSNRTGICYPARMMPVGCALDPRYAAVRRLQIERRVGDPCDPVVEQWLGCG